MNARIKLPRQMEREAMFDHVYKQHQKRFYNLTMHGVMGGRDLENNTMEVMRRDTLEKETITCEGIEAYKETFINFVNTSSNTFNSASEILSNNRYLSAYSC